MIFYPSVDNFLTEIYRISFSSETFRVLKNNEIKKYGEYRTQRLVLAAWDMMGY
jgi:hypothetical protein